MNTITNLTTQCASNSPPHKRKEKKKKISPLILPCCIVDFKRVNVIDQCYLLFSASTRATPERAGSHSGGPSPRGAHSYTHLPVHKHG